MIDKTKLKEAAWLVRDGSSLQGLHAEEAMHDFELLATPDAVLALFAEIDQLKAEVDSLTREADRQYTTIEAYRKDAERWRFFSVLANDLQAFTHSWGQMTPEKMDYMCDEAMAAAMCKEPQP